MRRDVVNIEVNSQVLQGQPDIQPEVAISSHGARRPRATAQGSNTPNNPKTVSPDPERGSASPSDTQENPKSEKLRAQGRLKKSRQRTESDDPRRLLQGLTGDCP